MSRQRAMDAVRKGTQQDVIDAIAKLSAQLSELAQKFDGFAPRQEVTVGASNLLARAAVEVARLNEIRPLPADLAAWTMRNLFEISAIFSTIIQSSEQLDRWKAQSVADEIQILEAARIWANESPDRAQRLESAIAYLRDVCAQFNLEPAANQFNIRALTDKLGRTEEYSVMFRLSSKFVHPSAALVNKRMRSDDQDFVNIFLIRAQEYALQLLHEANGWLQQLEGKSGADAI